MAKEVVHMAKLFLKKSFSIYSRGSNKIITSRNGYMPARNSQKTFQQQLLENLIPIKKFRQLETLMPAHMNHY